LKWSAHHTGGSSPVWPEADGTSAACGAEKK
jgi:hypothetical protein